MRTTLLPDGTPFPLWQPATRYARTWVVDALHPAATDRGPGSLAKPFATIGQAARAVGPGEEVLVRAGVYRETVRPRRGGTGPDAMVRYRVAAGETAIVTGAEPLEGRWRRVPHQAVWRITLPPERFPGQDHPFALPNVSEEQFDGMEWAEPVRGTRPFILARGLLFQDGRRLAQVADAGALLRKPGSYLVERGGRRLAVHPYRDADPATCRWEATARGTLFGPAQRLGWIAVEGFTFERAAERFPMPQFGALSVGGGHHWVLAGNTVRQVNGVGIDCGNQHRGRVPRGTEIGRHLVTGNTVEDCGICGIQALRCPATLIADNTVAGCAWHDAERLWETGAIKTHCNVDTLVRGNRVLGTRHGPGIWLDFANRNSRCCGNLVTGCRGGPGGIFVEASNHPNLVDHNVLVDNRGRGLYEHDSCGQTFAHNLVVDSPVGILLKGRITDRTVDGRTVAGGDHRAVNNLVLGCGEVLRTRDEQADLRGNVSDGIAASFDRERPILHLEVSEVPAKGEAVPGLDEDLLGKPRTGKRAMPGPFAGLVKGTMEIPL